MTTDIQRVCSCGASGSASGEAAETFESFWQAHVDAEPDAEHRDLDGNERSTRHNQGGEA